MKNQKKGFSSEQGNVRQLAVSAQDKQAMFHEFEIMQRLDFAFIKDIGASTAEEYVSKIVELKFVQRGQNGKRKN